MAYLQPMQVRIPTEMHKRLKEAMKREKATRSEIVRRAIEAYLNREPMK